MKDRIIPLLLVSALISPLWGAIASPQAGPVWAQEIGGTYAHGPRVFTWDGSQFLEDNDVYPVASGAAKQYTDRYVLSNPLLPKDGEYLLELRQSGDRISYTDLVRLIAVDHPSNVSIACDEAGDIWTYSSPVPLESARDKKGTDVKNQISTQDDSGFEGYNDDWIILDFGVLDISSGATLVLRVKGFGVDEVLGEPTGVDPQIHIQTPDGFGGWVSTSHIFYPRSDWAISAYNLTDDLSSELKVRLMFATSYSGEYHIIDYAGLDTSAQANITTHALSPASATHSTGGDVLDQISSSDDVYASMSPGENITLAFDVPAANEERDFVLVTEGYYAIFDAAPPVVSITPLSPDPTADSTPTLNGMAADTISPIASVEYRVDGGGWAAAQAVDGTFDELTEDYTFTTAALADGPHTVQVRATDALENTGTETEYASDTFTVDTAAPLVTIAQVGQESLIFEGTASDAVSNISSVEYRVGGGDWMPAEAGDGAFDSLTENYSFAVAAPSPDGPQLVEVRATDALGHVTLEAGWATCWVQSLTVEWHLVPFMAPDEELVGALSSVISEVDVVWGYDEVAEEWRMYSPEVPSWVNNLDYLEQGEVYWIKLKADGAWIY